jgi:CDP-glucose 4,6-dehydratase
VNPEAWRGRRVLITGHTGFKGSWLAAWLHRRGALVAGLALPPDTEPALFTQLSLASRIDHAVGDLRDVAVVRRRVHEVRPDVIVHLAAQSLVRRSYRLPVDTWSTNVLGTVHLLDALRDVAHPCAVLVATTDKVYDPLTGRRPYTEDAPLGGKDPYAASKVGTELAVRSYRESFFAASPVRLAVVRAGNVIGGGDWAEDRLLPDLARARLAGQTLQVRHPEAIRPWQHVLDALGGYLMLADGMLESQRAVPDALNFGPAAADQRPVREILAMADAHWPGPVSFAAEGDGLAEAAELTLATDRARTMLGWTPRWDVTRAVEATIAWYRRVSSGDDAWAVTCEQIDAFEAGT